MALRADLRDTVAHALGLNESLEAIIAIKSRQPSGFHGKVDHSQPPWNACAANIILDLHSWARESEALMRIRLNLPLRTRGGSSGNTRKALEGITALSQGCDDSVVRDSKRWLDGWCRKARIALGHEEAARRLPRISGERSPQCPWCDKDTLRQLALDGVIKCVDPSCTDSEGRRPVARLEMFHGEWTLRWQDGILGSP